MIFTVPSHPNWTPEPVGSSDIDITEIVKKQLQVRNNEGLLISPHITNSTIDIVNFIHPNVGKRPALLITYNTPPGQPTITYPYAAAELDGTHTITWSPAYDQEHTNLQYHLQLSTDGGVNWTDLVSLTPLTSMSYNFSAIPNSTASHIRVRAYDGYVYGPFHQSGAFRIYHNQSPYPPANLNPGSSGNPQLVATTTPNLNWIFLDPDVGDTPAAYHLVIYNGSTPIYDSGWQPSGISSFTVPSGLLNRGSTYGWQVRVKDERSYISGFSPLYYIRVNSLPVLTLTSYSDGETIHDNVLSLLWGFTELDGQPQTHYQVVGTQDNWNTWGYDSGEIASNSSTHTTPPLASGSWSFAVRVKDGLEWSDWRYRSNLLLPNAYEFNDTTAQAIPATYSQTYVSSISSMSDVDYYKYTAEANGIDRLMLTAPAGVNYDAYIFDSNMNLVASGIRDGGGVSENVLYDVTAGSVYYIKIFGTNGDSSTESYSFQISKLQLNFKSEYQYDPNGNIQKKSTNRIP